MINSAMFIFYFPDQNIAGGVQDLFYNIIKWVYTLIMEIGEICNCGLLRGSASHLTNIYNKALIQSGINITQFALLKYIYLLKGTNLKSLNSLLHQDRSTLGRNIRVIKNLQLIKSSVGKDKREVKIEITDLGKEKLENAYLDWQKIIEGVMSDGRIGISHYQVPGHDGNFGFGGTCFPKDINAFISYANKLGVKIPTIEGAWETNLNVRPFTVSKVSKSRPCVKYLRSHAFW